MTVDFTFFKECFINIFNFIDTNYLFNYVIILIIFLILFFWFIYNRGGRYINKIENCSKKNNSFCGIQIFNYTILMNVKQELIYSIIRDRHNVLNNIMYKFIRLLVRIINAVYTNKIEEKNNEEDKIGIC